MLRRPRRGRSAAHRASSAEHSTYIVVCSAGTISAASAHRLSKYVIWAGSDAGCTSSVVPTVSSYVQRSGSKPRVSAGTQISTMTPPSTSISAGRSPELYAGAASNVASAAAPPPTSPPNTPSASKTTPATRSELMRRTVCCCVMSGSQPAAGCVAHVPRISACRMTRGCVGSRAPGARCPARAAPSRRRR